jgi:hypothetical protein
MDHGDIVIAPASRVELTSGPPWRIPLPVLQFRLSAAQKKRAGKFPGASSRIL